jgi:hypothetical protein
MAQLLVDLKGCSSHDRVDLFDIVTTLVGDIAMQHFLFVDGYIVRKKRFPMTRHQS